MAVQSSWLPDPTGVAAPQGSSGIITAQALPAPHLSHTQAVQAAPVPVSNTLQGGYATS